MRFDPIKALDDAELLPPGRFPGGTSQAEATKICQELLESRGWEVESKRVQTIYSTDLIALLYLTFLWIAGGVEYLAGTVDFNWFCVWLILSVILHEMQFFRRLVSAKTKATELTATLGSTLQTKPVFEIFVMLTSQKPAQLTRWKSLISPMVRLVGLLVTVWAANDWINPAPSLQRFIFIMWWVGLSIYLYFLARLLELSRQVQSGRIWPENRESVGFVLELARAWALKPSSSVALRLHFKMSDDCSNSAPESGLWINQPGNSPGLWISEPAGTNLITKVCDDLRIPFEHDKAFARSLPTLGGIIAEGPEQVAPHGMALMSQVVHQSALRWAKSL